MTTFENHFAINMHIVPFLSGPALLVLCQTHHDFRSFSESFIVKAHEMIYDPYWRFCLAAKTGSRALCELARKWSSNMSKRALDWMLFGAACGGHRKLCILARAWACELIAGQSLNLTSMLEGATSGEHRDLCELAREWARETTGNPLDWNAMLSAAINTRNPKFAYEICELAHSWSMSDGSSLDWDHVLLNAAHDGYRDICLLVKSYGITKKGVKRMFLCAATRGNRELCELAHKWEMKKRWRLPYKRALHRAADRQDWDLCKLICSWM